MADNRHLLATDPTIVDLDPTSCHFRRVPVGRFRPAASAGVDVNSTINALNAGQSTPPHAAMAKVKNARIHSQPPIHSCKTPRPITPVKADCLEVLLNGYSFPLKNYLLQGFNFGFRVHFEGERRVFVPPNLKSALAQPDIVREKLKKEITAGRIAGPFQDPPFPHMFCSPLGIVPKKNPSEFRLIHHLSFPRGFSVNDFIPSEFSSVSYATINDAISALKRTGRGCFMAKTDIKSAFRIIPVHSDDHPLLGMKWENLYYYDRCLPMGCSSSCAIFEAFSTALEWIAINRLGASSVLHILDDFLFIAESSEKCQLDLNNFLNMCQLLGVPIAEEKTVGPNMVLQFAGITLDSVLQEARLPEDKLQKCHTLLSTFYSRRKVTLKELQSLIGLLNFTCSVILPGRAFLRRLIDLTIGIQRPYHRIRLNKDVKADLKVWMRFLAGFNGRAFFLDDLWVTSTTLELFTDAAGSKGYGAVFGRKWFNGSWPESWSSLNITFLEFFPIVIALHIWEPTMANKCICFVTDNSALVEVINRQTSKHKLIMLLVRDLVLTSLKYNILFRARHIAGIHNSRADLLSRLQVKQFKQIFPEADEMPTQVPDNLLPKSWLLH